MDIGFGIWHIMILAIITVLSILPVIAIIDVFKGAFKGTYDRWIWIMVVLLLNPLGTFLYFLIGKDQKLDQGKTGLLENDSSLEA